jgi:hypothetical protein
VFRLKTEGSKLSRKARIEPFKIFSEFSLITHDLPLKAFSLQPIYLSSYNTPAHEGWTGSFSTSAFARGLGEKGREDGLRFAGPAFRAFQSLGPPLFDAHRQ